MKLRDNFTSIRQRNKCRKQYPLGQSSDGKILHPWDYIRVQYVNDYGRKIMWCSPIYYTHIDGAYIVAHPDDIERHDGKEYHEDLNQYVGHSKIFDNTEVFIINVKEYEQWEEEVRIKKSIKIHSPKRFYLPETEQEEYDDDELSDEMEDEHETG